MSRWEYSPGLVLIASIIVLAGSKKLHLSWSPLLSCCSWVKVVRKSGSEKRSPLSRCWFWVGLYACSVRLWSPLFAIWRPFFKAPSALSPPLFAFIPLVIVLVTLPKDYSSRAAWFRKFCFVNPRSSCPIWSHSSFISCIYPFLLPSSLTGGFSDFASNSACRLHSNRLLVLLHIIIIVIYYIYYI